VRLQYGNHGDACEALNRQLYYHWGYREVGVPSFRVFGRKTEQAVKEFQRKHGLPVTGKVFVPTWKALVA
jgi:peptidoglycan hydrolase-like protein with peptidoglycan-binding domain